MSVTARAMPARRFASRGGEKLDAALDDFDLAVAGQRALDAGASTGGFTDCLLSRGASSVIAVDVAYGQLDWRLRTDERVTVLERSNVRTLTREAIGEPVDVIVADLAFISLRAVGETFMSLSVPSADLVLLVKPQFELPKAEVPHGGVVREAGAWARAIELVVEAYRGLGCGLAGVTASPLRGPKGNREFFVHLRRGGEDVAPDPIPAAIEAAP
ncbi:MAG TPA: TlyA family RNA methyltransferase [Actinomycetota bacterium]